jgi:hypothetical protein
MSLSGRINDGIKQMKKLFLSAVFVVWWGLCLNAQQLTDSNLPIVIINTDNGASIPDQPRIQANMKIIYNGEGQRNQVADQDDAAKLNYNGRILIETRGSSSQVLAKKQYGLTTVKADNITNNNVSLLGMPAENDWVLNGLAFDASLMRDYISYNFSRQIGNYAPRQHYCEMIINGSYQGLYILQEKVKVDDNRVDVAKIQPSDNTPPRLTGGYLIKADKVTSEDPSAWRMPTYINSYTDFIHEFPKPRNITSTQHNYIRNVFEQLAASVSNTSITNGFPSIIDIPSFVDFILVNELAANVDAYQFSTFFHKDRNGKLRAGPLWDLNLTYGNDLTFWGLDRSKTFTWQFDNGDNVGPRFWKDLFNNSIFRCYLSRRWNELTQPGEPLHLASMEAFIDQTVALISEAAVREHERWGTVSNHATHVSGIKNFLSTRISWITTGLGSFSECASVATPPLVITRIHYHPSTSVDFPDDNDQEFIEITNTGTSDVSVTGIYFSGTGLVYRFPDGATLPAGAIIQLANKTSVFRDRYGYLPYGEFTRSLSNRSQKITLADAWGNVIDQVEYSDGSPWPDADGNGKHLKLADVNADNKIATNWIATDEEIFSTITIVGTEEEEGSALDVYPNPTEGTITVLSSDPTGSVSVSNIQGIQLKNVPLAGEKTTIELSGLASGFYIITIATPNGVSVRKLVKK